MNDNLSPTILLIFLLVAIISTQSEKPISNRPFPYKIIAHRGASLYAPEHTSAAIEKAIKMNADYVEVDVQLSKDGHPVLFHDLMLDRTTNGTGPIYKQTLNELKKLDAGNWFHPSFYGQKILTLSEALERYQSQIRFLIEIKNPEMYPSIEKQLAKTLTKAVPKSNLNDIIIQSFDLDTVKRLSKMIPQLQTGLICNIHSEISQQEILKWAKHFDYVNPYFLTVNERLVNVLQQTGIKTFPWVIYHPETALKMFSYGVDGIITNDPLLKYTLPTNIQLNHNKETKSFKYHQQEDENLNNWSSFLKKIIRNCIDLLSRSH
ncbi:glycerophosphodiester phosphodiesterase [Texcoconibacillus texcoconensis]|uniref:Glycerophosphoryl diester phosphodiesterase n=1 Tax=Texcoconibacillus texcoconensis TaxID=1095777 RepID=A0A840QSX0_9BACI|nr:glycerophosphodiester phosphodiesterase family protein [Texcoconibacillus texcoconensis]MBB5174450.1 glycerophosphoryl diester phosphodiesterase [Texcoconibacillus texcoconensis]